MKIIANQWTSIELDEYQYKSMQIFENRGQSKKQLMDMNEHLWKSINANQRIIKVNDHTLSENNDICRAIERGIERSERPSEWARWTSMTFNDALSTSTRFPFLAMTGSEKVILVQGNTIHSENKGPPNQTPISDPSQTSSRTTFWSILVSFG